jgi:ATP citrate (pro-S)-lyase
MISIEALRKDKGIIVSIGSHPGIIQSMLDYDFLSGAARPRLRAIIANGHTLERYFWGETEVTIPVYATLEGLSADMRHDCTMVLNVQSARRVLSSTEACVRTFPNLKLLTIFAEPVPERHALSLAELAASHDVLIAGPASVGVLIPGKIKIGAIGGTQHPQLVTAKILSSGDTAVLSTSGGMVNELIHAVNAASPNVSFAIALGGDRFPVLSPATAMLLAEADPDTKRIVYFGELGGVDEYEIRDLILDGKIKKQIIAYVAGEVAEMFEIPPQFGHAKAMAQTQNESAAAKKRALREVGVTVVDTTSDLPNVLQRPGELDTEVMSGRIIGPRRKALIASHLSGDKDGDVQLLGRDLLTTVEANSLSGLIASMLLGREIRAEKTAAFVDYTLKLLSDHGPYVSGALNTIVSARAGKDLVSSLSAGLLTIGPRFGGAVNQAAKNWLEGVRSEQTAKQFVESFTARGGIIAGIGHKKHSTSLPDPRVAALTKFGGNGKDTYLTFAKSVEAVTTTKKPNLILNVDGAVAAIMLDILATQEGMSLAELEQLVDIEFFNALFVLSRSIGLTAHYMDQRRHDEGLLRLSDDEVRWIAQS